MNKHFSFGKYEVSIPKLKDNLLSVRNSKSKNSAMTTTLISAPVRELLLDYKDHQKFSISSYNKLHGTDREIVERLLKMSGMDEELGIRITDDELDRLVQDYEQVREKIMSGNDDPALKNQLKRYVIELVKRGKLPLRTSFNMLLELLLLE